MSKEQLDLLHYQNKCQQLQQLLDAEREKTLKLKKILAEVRFAALPFLKKLERL